MLGWLRFLTESPSTPAGVERSPEPARLGVHYDTRWARRPAARIIREAGVYAFMKPAIRFYGSPRAIGQDRLQRVKGPVLFAANHHSHADTSLLLATIPGHLRRKLAVVAAADYFFPNQVAAAASALFLGAIPIERHRISKLSIKNAIDAVTEGYSLLVYPEGGRSPDGWGQEHRPGAAFVAKRTGIPVVPVYLDGTGSILPKGKNWPKRSRCAVVFGDPLELDANEDARAFAARIEHRVAELADEFSSGWWAARRKAYGHGGKTEPLNGPLVGAWRRRWALGPKPGHDPDRTQPRWPNL